MFKMCYYIYAYIIAADKEEAEEREKQNRVENL